jgi:hypothetical protein
MKEQILYIHDHHMPACGSDLITQIDGWESILIGQIPSTDYPNWMNKLFWLAIIEDCNYIIFSSDADQDADREDIPSYGFYWYFDGDDLLLGDPVTNTQVRLSYNWDNAKEIAKILKGEQTYFKMVYEYKMDTKPLQVQNIIHTHDDLHSIVLGKYDATFNPTAENMGFIRMIASAYKGGK